MIAFLIEDAGKNTMAKRACQIGVLVQVVTGWERGGFLKLAGQNLRIDHPSPVGGPAHFSSESPRTVIVGFCVKSSPPPPPKTNNTRSL